MVDPPLAEKQQNKNNEIKGNMIECESLIGGKVLKNKDEMCFRVSAYGFITQDHKILLSKLRSTGKYFVPGGGVNILNESKGINETLKEGLTREIKEETGLEVKISEHFFFTETFFNYNPIHKPELAEVNYCHCHFFLCEPRTFQFCSEEEIADEESTLPEWISLNDLKEEECQPLLWLALEAYKKRFL